MKAIVHTPSITVEEWVFPGDIPDDTTILRAITGEYPGIVGARMGVSELRGDSFVAARINDAGRLEDIGLRIKQARAAYDAVRKEAQDAMEEELAAGASERSITARLGLDRNTIRSWRGKPVRK